MPQTSNVNIGSSPRPRRFLTRSRTLLALAVGAIGALTYTFWPRAQPFFFEVTIRSSLPGFAQLYYDTGSGINEKHSSRLPVAGGNRAASYRFRLPDGIYSTFRFDPTDRPRNTMALAGPRIVDRGGNLVRAIPPRQFQVVDHQVEGLEAGDDEVTFTTAAAAVDPILRVELEEPVFLKSYSPPSLRTLFRRCAISFIFCMALGLLTGPALVSIVRATATRLFQTTAGWAGARPAQFLIASAAISVVASCYPIVFFGKSFLSPNNHSHTYLLYGEMPTVPGYQDISTDDEKGSDLGAAMWYSWPTSVVQNRALFKHFELPLWNRYNSGGLPLLGQGQSMFGDPLHFLVVLAKGASAWWDLKYILAKFLFATSLGFCVLQLTRHLPAATIIALSSPFIGFFAFRYSHPAFFSVCYAPLILLSWFKFIDAPKGRVSAFWLAMMALANWMVINSGTVKEAYILLLAMNSCGCLTLLLTGSIAGKMTKLLQALSAQLLFVLIAAPIWVTFLMTLRSSWTVYAAGGAFQLQPSLFVGLFDDIFYRQFNTGEQHFVPSANFLVLAGVLWFCFNGARADPNRLSRGLGLTCLLAVAFAFGIIPPSLIARIPFLGAIYHIDNTFSCVAIVCLILLAGFGIKSFWIDCLAVDFRRTYLRVMAGFGGLLCLYLGTTEAVQRSSIPFLHAGQSIPKSTFFWGYFSLLVLALIALPWIGRLAIKGHRVTLWPALPLTLIFIALHWRHGMHLETPFDSYVMNPQPRTHLIAESSPALKFITSTAAEPSRSTGLGYNLAPGYGGAIGVEMIDSADPLLNKHYKSLIDVYGVKLLLGSSINDVVENQLEDNLPIFDMLNVRYFLDRDGSKADVVPSLRKIASLDLNVYESSKAWPRAFFTDRPVSYAAQEEFVRLLKAGDGVPFAAIAQPEVERHQELAPLIQDAKPAATRQIIPATNYRLTNNTTSLKVTAPGPGVVVLTEAYISSDFKVRVNAEPAPYFLVNGAFKGVFLPKAGQYDISYRYWPSSFTLTLWVSGFGLLLFTICLVLVARGSERQPQMAYGTE